MAKNKIVRSMSLRQSTVERGQAIIDLYGLGKGMESKLADEILSRGYASILDSVAETTANGVRFNLSFSVDFDDES